MHAAEIECATSHHECNPELSQKFRRAEKLRKMQLLAETSRNWLLEAPHQGCLTVAPGATGLPVST
jgi:hypothetical protein